MSTVKTCGCWLACCLISSAAWGQYDAPPTVPDFAAPPAESSTTVFPELPVPPQPQPAAPVRRVRPLAPAQRPRLSAESTANLPKQVQNVIDFYGGATSARALAQLPQRPSTGDARPPVPTQAGKPFDGSLQNLPPTVSPYMNLYIEEGPEALPNFYTYVRPAFQQQQTNAAARQDLRTLNREVQQASYGQAVGQAANGSVPGTGHGTRYFNTTNYYPATRRLR